MLKNNCRWTQKYCPKWPDGIFEGLGLQPPDVPRVYWPEAQERAKESLDQIAMNWWEIRPET
jgi:hypothetical protein